MREGERERRKYINILISILKSFLIRIKKKVKFVIKLNRRSKKKQN